MFDYTVETNKSWDEAVRDLETNLKDEKFGVLWNFDFGSVSEKLSVLYKKNEGLQIDDEGKFIKRVTEGLKEQPNAYEDIRQTNMGKINPPADEAKEMETGPNNCAV